jgi:hypothetical protein
MCDDRASSPEPQSILKRRSSLEDLELDACSRSSPEPMQGILKRKYSSTGGSGSHSPESVGGGDGGDGGRRHNLFSILKKQGSLEDVEFPSSAYEDSRIKSILKKKQVGSTDDELEGNHQQQQQQAGELVLVGGGDGRPPRSILKSRKSEESLSPLSDPNDVVVSSVSARRAPTNLAESAAAEFGVRPRPILKRKDSREDMRRTLSPSSDE